MLAGFAAATTISMIIPALLGGCGVDGFGRIP
jgi:hypothetical protein